MANNNSIDCTFFSYNVNGINEPVKRSLIFNECRRAKSKIVMLQESHFKVNHTPYINLKNFPHVFFSNNPTKKATGVITMLHRDLPYTHKETLTDKEGRFLIVKGKLAELKCTIANVYVPNQGQIIFLRQFLEILENFAEGLIILGGDFNLTLNPLIDTSSLRTNISYRGLKEIKKLLAEQRLIDIWRTKNPKKRDFTHFSKTNNVYSRIDYIFISQQWAHLFNKTFIGNSSVSDHSPVLTSFTIPHTFKPEYTWKFNDLLLHREQIKKQIQTLIIDTLQNNDTPEISPSTNWETLKCVVRGLLISLASKLKREREKEITLLVEEISKLEQTHKETLARNISLTLESKRMQLKALLEQKIYKAYMRSKQRSYELGDKCNKHFTRIIKKMQPQTYISSIKDQNNIVHYDTRGIAEVFQKYYQNTRK
uniref:exodeoxyribonuclease III n=1 Tax=Xenopus tropicalis TaxID=8364 RepID=A0A803JJM6_XENTR